VRASNGGRAMGEGRGLKAGGERNNNSGWGLQVAGVVGAFGGEERKTLGSLGIGHIAWESRAGKHSSSGHAAAGVACRSAPLSEMGTRDVLRPGRARRLPRPCSSRLRR
jgi:hypothetical protein